MVESSKAIHYLHGVTVIILRGVKLLVAWGAETGRTRSGIVAELQAESGSEESMVGPPQPGAAVDTAVSGNSPVPTDRDVVNDLGCGTSVAVPGGAVNLTILEPGAQDL